MIFMINLRIYVKKMIFIWNRQRKRSLPACGAAVQLHFIIARRAADKPLERDSAPGPRGGGGSPSDLPLGPLPPEPLPPFQQHQVCYDKVVILPRMCNLNFASRHTNSRFLFPILDKVLYVPR